MREGKRRGDRKEQRWQRRKKEKNIDEGGERLLKGRGKVFFSNGKGRKKMGGFVIGKRAWRVN